MTWTPSTHGKAKRDRGRRVWQQKKTEREAERVKHGADREIRRRVSPDTTLPLMTGVKQCNDTADFSR